MHTLLPEWAPQQSVLLVWPDEQTDWLPWLDTIQRAYILLIQQIAHTTPVTLIVRSQATAATVQPRIGLTVHPLIMAVADYDDTWIRDYGPISTQGQNGQLTGLDFQFNAWGAKYSATRDTEVTRTLLTQMQWDYIHQTVPVVLEGGAIETNGQGHLIANPKTLIGPNRNPGMSLANLEAILRPLLGITHWHWLPLIQLAGDDTDGHVDTLVRYLNPNTLAYAATTDTSNPNFAVCQELAKWCESWAAGAPDRRCVPIYNPASITNDAGEALPATYLNFLITNGQLIVPTYEDRNDAIALHAFAAHCPDYKVVGVNAKPLIHQFGSIHCATMPIFARSFKENTP